MPIRFSLWLILLIVVVLSSGCSTTSSTYYHSSTPYFGLRFVDIDTGKGVPLVEIKTTNYVRYVSDSAGWIAIDPFEFGSSPIFFWVKSDGYELNNKGRAEIDAITLQLKPGDRSRVGLKRKNIAERLYRITGEGIYHHSRKLGVAVEQFHSDKPRGGVFGQDSVTTALYKNKLFWYWGDTRRGNGRLGNFNTSGATSPSPLIQTVDAEKGIDLHYFVDSTGFSKKMCPFEEPGAVWIRGLSVIENSGSQSMFCHYIRVKQLGHNLEHGIAEWDNEQQIFVKRRTFPVDSPLFPKGDPLKLLDNGQLWFYYGMLFRDIRVRATRHHLLDLKNYESYTCLTPGSRWNPDSPPLDLDSEGNLIWGWKQDTDLVDYDRWELMARNGVVQSEDNPYVLIDMETGKRVVPDKGSIARNRFNDKWTLIATQAMGDSVLGEVWYAVADSPMGPWSKARKIVSHKKYSFYNVKQHPYFASDSFIYFEGTYTAAFSGSKDPTPRYDYNQIMYRLDLRDPRLPKIAPLADQFDLPPNLVPAPY